MDTVTFCSSYATGVGRRSRIYSVKTDMSTTPRLADVIPPDSGVDARLPDAGGFSPGTSNVSAGRGRCRLAARGGR